MERIHNTIETPVDIQQMVKVVVNDEQLGKGAEEAAIESPAKFVGYIGREAALKMAAVLWVEDPTSFMGEIIAYASNPNTQPELTSLDDNLSLS